MIKKAFRKQAARLGKRWRTIIKHMPDNFLPGFSRDLKHALLDQEKIGEVQQNATRALAIYTEWHRDHKASDPECVIDMRRNIRRLSDASMKIGWTIHRVPGEVRMPFGIFLPERRDMRLLHSDINHAVRELESIFDALGADVAELSRHVGQGLPARSLHRLNAILAAMHQPAVGVASPHYKRHAKMKRGLTL